MIYIKMKLILRNRICSKEKIIYLDFIDKYVKYVEDNFD